MQFLVLGYDGTDKQALERRMAAREAHIAGCDELHKSGKMLYGAAILDDDGKMIGSAIICDFEDRKELDGWLNEEAYVTGKVWEKIEIKPCKVGPSFAHLNTQAAGK
jgi:Uncharacterized protein conserved in bacteria